MLTAASRGSHKKAPFVYTYVKYDPQVGKCLTRRAGKYGKHSAGDLESREIVKDLLATVLPTNDFLSRIERGSRMAPPVNRTLHECKQTEPFFSLPRQIKKVAIARV